MLSISIVVPIVLLVIIFLCLLWRYSYWYRKGVPQGNPLKLFGDNNDFTICRGNYLSMYKSTYNKRKESPFRGVYQLFKPSLFLCDPDLIKDVMLNISRVFPDTASRLDEQSDPILAEDPFFQTGEKWKDSRSRFSTLLTPSKLRAILPYILEGCSSMNEYIRKLKHESGQGDGVEVHDLTNKFVTDALVAVLLGGKAASFSPKESVFQEIGKAIFKDSLVQNLAMLTIIGAPHLAQILKLRIIPKETADLLARLIKEEAQRRKESGITRQDVFDGLLKKTATCDEEAAMKTIIASIITFYAEGFESSSLLGAFILLHLAKNPDIQDNLREQLREKSPPGTKLNEEAVSIQLLTNCILESMRLTPPVTLVQRTTNEDYTLRASTGEEAFIQKGTTISIPIAGLHQDESIFPNPETFDPDRFEDAQQSRYFIGFGDGPRACIGQRYAQQSLSVLIASIIRDFKVEISPKMRFPLKIASHPFFSYPADGVWLRLVPCD